MTVGPVRDRLAYETYPQPDSPPRTLLAPMWTVYMELAPASVVTVPPNTYTVTATCIYIPPLWSVTVMPASIDPSPVCIQLVASERE